MGGAMGERTLKLSDEATGFHDPETGLKILRDQTVKIGHTIGRLTAQAVATGRLIEVKLGEIAEQIDSTESESKEEPANEFEGIDGVKPVTRRAVKTARRK
jgi:hypothetical protein